MSETPLHPETPAVSQRPASPHPLARFFFLQPIFAILLCVLMVVGGYMGANGMVKEDNPDVNTPLASVETVWAGADPETIENQVTDKLEAELKSLKALKDLDSASFEGFSRIEVEFDVNAPTSESIAAVRAKVDAAEAELPKDDSLELPKVERISVQDTPVLILGLYGDIDPAVMGRSAEDLQERLEKISNIREVNLVGARREVVHVQLLPERLVALELSATEVAKAVEGGNIDMPWDRIENDAIGSQVRLYGRYRSIEDLRSVPVARLGDKDDRVVRLGEVAVVERDLEQEVDRAFLSTQGSEYEPAIVLEVVKAPGADTFEVIESAVAEMDSARSDPAVWPYGMEYRVVQSDDTQILRSLNNLLTSGGQGVLCVFAILFLALSWREALVAGLSIPLTFLGALAVLWMMGNTLNTMVQVGMIIALGLLVDVFILMMEGMHEGIFVEGLDFDRAALKTVKTYALPAFSGQLTTILAMAPLAAIGGFLGKFIRYIPISAITCLVISYFIALFVAIPLSRYLLANQQGGDKKSTIDRLTEIGSRNWTQWTLRGTIPNKMVARFWVAAALGLFVFATILAGTLPSNLFPTSDQVKLAVNVEMPPNTTLNTSQQVADELGEVFRDKAYLKDVVKFVGRRSTLVAEGTIIPTQGSYLIGFSALFKNRNEREFVAYKYLDELRAEVEAIVRTYPGASFTLSQPASGTVGDPVAIEVFGSDMGQLRQISGQIQNILREIEGTADVRDDLGTLRPDLKFRPRREALDFYGLSLEDLALQGRYLMAATDIGNFPIGGGQEDLDIYLSTRWPSRGGDIGGPTRPDELRMLRAISPAGEVLYGSQILDREPSLAPLSITHKDGQRTVTVISKAEGVTAGEILAVARPEIEALKATWPQGYGYRFGGESEDQSETFGSAGQMAMVALFLVFSVLVIQFSSFSQPFIIILSLPFALIGTFTGFFLWQIPISFPAVIGIIALTGIVVNDAIVIVETMNNHRDNGLSVREAAARGAGDRLRPVLTTSLTTIFGVLPLSLSDPAWFPLCLAVAAGLGASTISALTIVPCLYLLLTPERRF